MDAIGWIVLLGVAIFGLALLAMSIVIVRPTQRGLIEKFGKYNRFLAPGIHFKVPFIENAYGINVTEKLVNAERQEVITQDNLNAVVDAQVYFRVKPEEENVKNSQYNVYDVEEQIVALARTTLRDIIGKMPFKDVNSKRNVINGKLAEELVSETKNWGIQIVRTELKEISPPQDVQETMNKVLKAENEKLAATDFATARETEADGYKRAEIKKAEGDAAAIRLKANAEADAIKVVSESSEKYFKEKAQIRRQLDVAESWSANTKLILPSNAPLLNVLPFGNDDIVNTVVKKGK